MPTATGITIEEFERLPDALAHNHELVNGGLVDVSGNTEYHNSLRDLLVRLLAGHVEELRIGRSSLSRNTTLEEMPTARMSRS